MEGGDVHRRYTMSSQSHPPSSISSARFKLLKIQALSGDHNATSTLHLIFSYSTSLGLDDVLPVIHAHLSSQHLAQVKGVDGTVAMNARYALKMLAHGLDKSQQQLQLHPPSSTIETLCPMITSWIALFIESTSNDLILRELGHIIPPLLRHHPLRNAFRKENILLPLILHTWLSSSSSLSACRDFQTAVLTALIAEAKLVPGHPDLEHSMRALLAAQPSDVARAVVRSFTAADPDALRLSLSTIFYCRSCIPSVRRALAVEGVLDVLCRAARHHPWNMGGSCMCLLIQELSVFTRMAPCYVIRALEQRVLDTLLRVDRVMCSSDDDETMFDDREDTFHLSRMITACLSHLEAFLIYKSVLRACRKAIRRVGEGVRKTDSEVQRQYEQLREAVEAQVKENEARDRESKCVCVNPDCTSLTPSRPRRCSGCLFAVYCSRQCQKAHWANGHRTQCPILDEARTSPSRALHLPPSPLDMDAIYAMVEDDLREYKTQAITSYSTPFVVELDYASEWGDVSSRPRISVRPLDAFRRAMEESSVIEYTDAIWDHLLDRDEGRGGTYIAIIISSMWLVDLTTEERMRRRLYPIDIPLLD
ncbi:hypothetical protein CPB85DRAFT_1315434 [Mucidula mucida]|nr:hypothetical protein CPB85DRAFT_1315434 [Mucidula mucida]